MSEFIECARKTELGHAGALKLAFQSIFNIGWAIQKSWAMNLYGAGYGVNEDQPNRHAKIREIDARSSEQTWNPVEKGEKDGIRRLERQGEMRRQSYECISCLHILSDRQPPSSFLADLLLLQRTHFATLLLHPVNETFATFGASPSPTPPPGYECDTHFHPFFTLYSK